MKTCCEREGRGTEKLWGDEVSIKEIFIIIKLSI